MVSGTWNSPVSATTLRKSSWTMSFVAPSTVPSFSNRGRAASVAPAGAHTPVKPSCCSQKSQQPSSPMGRVTAPDSSARAPVEAPSASSTQSMMGSSARLHSFFIFFPPKLYLHRLFCGACAEFAGEIFQLLQAY